VRAARPLPLRIALGAAVTALAVSPIGATQQPLDIAVEAELVAEHPGGPLVAGGRALLAWSSAEPLPGVEEWEAFLSYDGGRSWPVRLTPHLDASRRRVAVELPPIATDDARLLLRFGDEREERELEVGHRFEIAPAAPDPMAPAPLLALANGEAARPGVAGVVWWIDGDRDGRSLVRRAARTDSFAAGVPALREAESERVATASSRAPTLPQPAEQAFLLTPSLSRADSPAPARAPAAVGRRLALLSRRNR
jgi:hypothetical protein